MKLIDDETGEAPTLKNGDSFSFQSTVIIDENGGVTGLPDALTAEGEEAYVALVRRTSAHPGTSEEGK